MNASAEPTLIVIAGPTAVGKTRVAIEVAKHLKTEIVSADSRQCYSGMAIGTAQPDIHELNEVPHHFINCFSPEVALSAADFERIALAHLEDLFLRNNTAVVCGGTGLYIKALCEGLDEMPPVIDAINASVNKEYLEKGIDWLKATLQKNDPEFFVKGEGENPARMLRALTFYLSNGQSIHSFRTGLKKKRPFRIIKIGLELPRDLLYQRINIRVEKMIEDGLIQEAQNLYSLRHLKNLNTVGYTELFDYFEGKISLPVAIDKIKQHSRNYAKRQLTWFKKDNSFHWTMADNPDILKEILNFL